MEAFAPKREFLRNKLLRMIDEFNKECGYVYKIINVKNGVTRYIYTHTKKQHEEMVGKHLDLILEFQETCYDEQALKDIEDFLSRVFDYQSPEHKFKEEYNIELE